MANTKTVYLRHTGAEKEVDESPLEPGVWLIPPKCVEEKPPSFDASKKTCKYIDDEWVVADIIDPLDKEEEPFEVGDTPAASVQLRTERNNALKATDYFALSDQTLSADMKTYRQKLRDLPSVSTPSYDTDGTLLGVTWPIKP